MVLCIECGSSANEDIYKEFSPQIIKLTNCIHCDQYVDKYIEYDTTIIFLDVVLFKIQAYRHILFNSTFINYWKLSIFILLSEAFIKYINKKDFAFYSNPEKIDFNLDMNFYLCFLDVITDFILYLLAIYIFINIYKSLINTNMISIIDLFKTLTLSSYGKLFSILTLPWVGIQNSMHIYLVHILVFASNSLGIYVRYNIPMWLTILYVSLSFYLINYIDKLSLFSSL
ncbi:unnamed protein product [Gordionus sp. m RMFG-2023]